MNNQNWWQSFSAQPHDPNESSTKDDVKFGLSFFAIPLLLIASVVALLFGLARLLQ
jgi:hypothetical protein